MLNEEQIPFLYYFGDLTRDQKNAAIAKFQDNPNIKVLVSNTPRLFPTPASPTNPQSRLVSQP